MEEKINAIKTMIKLSNIANYYMDTYCDLNNEYVLSKKEIEEIEYPEDKEKALNLYNDDKNLQDSSSFIKKYTKDCLQELVNKTKEFYKNKDLDRASIKWNEIYDFIDEVTKDNTFFDKNELLQPTFDQFSDKEVYDITDNIRDLEYARQGYENYPKLSHSTQEELNKKIRETDEKEKFYAVCNGKIYWEGTRKEVEQDAGSIRDLVQDVAREDGYSIDTDEVDFYTKDQFEQAMENSKRFKEEKEKNDEEDEEEL